MHTVKRIATGLCVAALVHGCAADADPQEETDSLEANQQALAGRLIPPELAVPAGSQLALVRFAEGVQIYDCKADGGAATWTFRAPVADLYTVFGWPAGTHYAGPTWESTDGSTVVAARVASASVDASSIPWLLLKATSHTGSGRLSSVQYVQRLFTHGGNAPSGACTVGSTVEVDYTAFYAFYR